jgi:predicted transcriptional regulator
MTRKLYEIAADIIEAQAETGPMTPDALEQALSTVFVTLQRMKIAEDGGFLLDQAKPSEEPVQEGVPVDPKSSIQEDKVICLECSKEMRQLTAKHLGSHGLTIREYKTKYGFPQRQSLSALSLSRARSKSAKKRGLPEKLLRFQEQRKQEKAAVLEHVPAATKAPAKKRAKTNAPAKRRAKKKAE